MAVRDLEKRSAFASAYAECGNATKAALVAGVPKSSAHSMGYKWLRNDQVVGLVREAMYDRMRELGPLAVNVIKEVLLSEQASPQTRLQAARDILDRLGWVPPRRAEVVQGQVSELDRMSIEELEAIVSAE